MQTITKIVLILLLFPPLPLSLKQSIATITCKIATIHSEVISLEDPIKDDTIKKYIAIRPEIKEHMINNFEIPEEMIEVIYNPVDEEKFQPKNIPSENYVLFVGTMSPQPEVEDS